jgi:DNA-binding IclR family transcriptional regulator
MSAGTTTRQDDERVLVMIARRAAGVDVRRIAAAFGMTRQSVYAATQKVLAADLAHPDPGATRARIAGAYW